MPGKQHRRQKSVSGPTQSSENRAASEEDSNDRAKEIASQALSGDTGQLPFLDAIESSFGGRDLGGVDVAMGGDADDANDGLGSSGFAMGGKVALKAGADLHTAAHEATHLFQAGAGPGRAGDSNEQQANAVADRVVAGQSAADLLTGMPMSPSGSGGLQLDTGTPDLDSAESDVDAARADVEGAQQDVEQAVETGEEVVETAEKVWKVVIPYLKGEKEFREDKTVWEEKGPVSLSPDISKRHEGQDLLSGVPLISFNLFTEYGLSNIRATDIRVVSTDPDNADFKAQISASAGAEGGARVKAGPEIQMGDRFTAFAGVMGDLSARLDAGTVDIPIHKTQSNGKWSGEGFKMELGALNGMLKAQAQAGAFIKWTSRRGKERQIGKMYPWPEDAVLAEGNLAGITIDNTGEKFQILVGEDPFKDRIAAVGEKIGDWFEERPRLLHRKAEEAEASEGDVEPAESEVEASADTEL